MSTINHDVQPGAPLKQQRSTRPRHYRPTRGEAVMARQVAQRKAALIRATPGARELLAEFAAISGDSVPVFLASLSVAELEVLLTGLQEEP